jgi:spermidine/putrescine transport system permease protein
MRNRRANRSWVVSVLPGTAWIGFFLVLPCLFVAVISFLSRGEFGQVERPWTLANYKQLAGFGLFGFEPVYPLILLRSTLLALTTTFICAVASLPLAFFLRSLTPRRTLIGLVLLTVPIWTNLLVRTYAWQLLLAPDGWVTRVAAALGMVRPGEALYPGTLAVLACLVCDFLPIMALPVYASVEKLDPAFADAARDLGASRWNVFRHGIYPQISSGLWAGILLVFLPALGQFVVPDLLGGAKTILLGNLLQQQFGPSRDWPFGAAVTTVFLVIIAAAVLLYQRKRPNQQELL